MAHRSIMIDWLPRSRREWDLFTTTRLEAGRLWADLVERHFRIRRAGWRWPSTTRWQKWTKQKYPGLSAQSAQQIVTEFCEAVCSARQLRKNGQPDARYPWRRPRYRDVLYSSQGVRVVGRNILLCNGRNRTLSIRVPDGVHLPGRVTEARLAFGKVTLIFQVDEAGPVAAVPIGIDLGINTLLAATDGNKAILVSGREAKATVQWRNKRLAGIQQRQAKMQRGSSRRKRLQRRKYRLLAKAKRRLRDLAHKATRLVANEFPQAHAFVGRPFNDAAQNRNRKQAQQISQALNRVLISMLVYKLAGTTEVSEAYTSQTCPVCGERRRAGRIYHCPCGLTAPRDAVGALNILSIGSTGNIQRTASANLSIKYLRPRCRSSSGGHPASSSA